MGKKTLIQKLTFILSFCSLIIIAFIILSMLKLAFADRSLSSIYNDRIMPLKQLKIVSDGYSNDLIINIQKFNSGVLVKDSVLARLDDITARIKSNWQEYLATYLTPEEKEQIKKTEIVKIKVDKLIDEIKKNITNEIWTYKEKDYITSVQSEYFVIVEPLLKEIDELIRIQITESEKLKSTIKVVFGQIKLLSTLNLIMCLLIVWFFIYRRRLEHRIFNQTIELEAKNDELNTVNEELITNLEQLDITNEELFASNEELTIVNEQLNIYKNDLEQLIEDRTQKLTKSELHFKGIFNNAYDAIIILKDGVFVDCNTRTLEMFECARIEFIGKSPSDFSPERQISGKLSSDLVQELLKQAKEGNIQIFEWRNIKYKSKQEFDVEISLNKLEINGEILIQAIVRDITERKRHEAALAKAQTFLNATFESTEDLIFALDATDFKVIALNSAAKKFYSSANVVVDIGTNMEDMFHHDRIPEWQNFYTKVFEFGAFNVEYTTQILNRNLWLSFYPLISNGKTFGISVFARDITQMKLADEQMQILKHSIDFAPDGAYWNDSSGNFIYVNESGYKNLGYTKEEFSNMVIQDISPYTTPERWANILKQLREKGSYFAEIMHRRKDGTLFPVEISVTYIYFNGKEFINSFAKDITERKILEQKMLHSIVETEEHERMNFSQELHDGLGPLISSIKMYIQLISLPGSKMEIVKAAQMAETLIDEASRTIREISFRLSPTYYKTMEYVMH